MIDIVIEGGTIVTMDDQRKIIQNGSIAIEKGTILDVGTRNEISAKYNAKQVLDANKHAVLPGLIDTHGHSGHSMMKTIAETGSGWGPMIEEVYLRGVKEEFWYIDSVLASLERIRFGVTTGATFLGGGRGAYRTDNPKFAELHMDGAKEVGIREILGLGPVGRAPYTPREFRDLDGEKEITRTVDFDGMMDTSRKIIEKYGDFNDIVTARMTVSSISPNLDSLSVEDQALVRKQAKEIRELADESGRGIMAHGGGGVIKSAKELDLLGPDVMLVHCGGLTKEDINIFAETGTHVSHCPRARAIMRRRCPVPELLDAGVNVALGTDGTAPDRTFDTFSDMRTAQTIQRHFFHDSSYMPPGKVLGMATIDAANALGIGNEIGSLEAGKRADVILLNLNKPHLTPRFMIPQRIVYEAYGHDVETSIIDGKIVMENRVIKTINEEKALDHAQRVADEVVEFNNLEKYMGIPEGFWRNSKYD
ncbi:amidohydrolase [Candidatus Bathyarchaeota archaeon]|nr:amidohydrolase [Candidatus Bathyarchaeota archaeon]